jgi:hypothetical protein
MNRRAASMLTTPSLPSRCTQGEEVIHRAQPARHTDGGGA